MQQKPKKKTWTRLNCCGFMSLFRDFSSDFSIWRDFMGIVSLSTDRVKSFQIKWKIWRLNTVNYDFLKINKQKRRKAENEEKNIIPSLDRGYNLFITNWNWIVWEVNDIPLWISCESNVKSPLTLSIWSRLKFDYAAHYILKQQIRSIWIVIPSFPLK